MLNRSAVTLRPGKPFLEWIRSQVADDIPIHPERDPTVYLLPPWESAEEGERMLRSMFSELFVAELSAWCTDRKTWPEIWSYSKFHQWFHVELHEIVEDMAGGLIGEDEG